MTSQHKLTRLPNDHPRLLDERLLLRLLWLCRGPGRDRVGILMITRLLTVLLVAALGFWLVTYIALLVKIYVLQ